jgi:hypothetical protein
MPSSGNDRGDTDGIRHIALLLQIDVAAQEDIITSTFLGSFASDEALFLCQWEMLSVYCKLMSGRLWD